MHHLMGSLLLLAGVAGCAVHQDRAYGNFLDAGAAPVQPALADAALQHLARLLAPGHTRLALQQPTPDVFGQSLVAGLRARGYALQEFHAATATAAPEPVAAGNADGAAAALPLGYLLDQAAGAGLYRLSLRVGAVTLTRVYQAHADRLAPAGAWVRKELQ